MLTLRKKFTNKILFIRPFGFVYVRFDHSLTTIDTLADSVALR